MKHTSLKSIALSLSLALFITGCSTQGPSLMRKHDAATENLLSTWNQWENINPARLQTMEPIAQPVDKGWIELSLIYQSSMSPEALEAAIQNWEQLYPNHPARTLIENRGLFLKETPRHVALLLPLKGELAQSSEAIRNGFMAAYYTEKEHQGFAPSITVYDTSKGNVAEIYQQAIHQGADFVVGPLTKPEVSILASTELSVPTLALNSAEETQKSSTNNLIQFDLSSRSEAQAVAQKAWGNHYREAVIFTLNDPWNQSIAEAFKQQWKAQGGGIFKIITVENTSQLDASIRQLFNVQIVTRAGKTQNLLKDHVNFDFVFLATSATQAQSIVPLLRYYYQGEIPVYATSLIYDGNENKMRTPDLDGIVFCSIPWLISPDTNLSPSLLEIRHRIQSLWAPTFNKTPKLFALGVDAYELIPKLNQLNFFPNLGIHGATGQLYLSTNHSIYRELLWAEIENEVVVPLGASQ